MEKISEKFLIPILIFFLTTLFVSQKVLGHSGGEKVGEDVKVDHLVTEILQKQGVSRLEDINCAEVSDSDFENLGEAVMSRMHPDKKVHQAMDNMMGGEGSEGLREAHILMGKRYLGCEGNGPGFMGMGPMMGMMGNFTGKSFPLERGWKGMMGFGFSGMSLWSLFGLLTWISVLAFFVLGSIYFWKEIKKK